MIAIVFNIKFWPLLDFNCEINAKNLSMKNIKLWNESLIVQIDTLLFKAFKLISK